MKHSIAMWCLWAALGIFLHWNGHFHGCSTNWQCVFRCLYTSDIIRQGQIKTRMEGLGFGLLKVYSLYLDSFYRRGWFAGNWKCWKVWMHPDWGDPPSEVILDHKTLHTSPHMRNTCLPWPPIEDNV